MGAEQEGRVLTSAPLTLQGRQTALLPSCCQPVPQSFGGVIFSVPSRSSATLPVLGLAYATPLIAW